MIKIVTKPIREDLPEMTVNLDEVKFIKCLSTCPKCKLIDNVFIFNVTMGYMNVPVAAYGFASPKKLDFRYGNEVGNHRL